MSSQTESTIDAVDIANDDLIDVLAQLSQFHETNGYEGQTRLAVIGDGSHRMLTPAWNTNVVETDTIYSTELVEDGEVVDQVEINDQLVDVQVL